MTKITIFSLEPMDIFDFNDFDNIAFRTWKTIPEELKKRYDGIETVVMDDTGGSIAITWKGKPTKEYFIEEMELI